jgi:RNA polymerase sigma factor (sigma-70 family)
MTDQELLRAFGQDGDEFAFRQIVDRYLAVVHAAARRQVRGCDAHLAEDVTQAVFIMLARKAGSLKDGTVLAGWLVTAARHVARTAARGETRRKRHEQRVADMTPRSTRTSSRAGTNGHGHSIGGGGAVGGAFDVDNDLDEALARLSPADRTAITLRYLQDNSVREVAQTLGIGEAAANKRVLRALSRLREVLSTKRGAGRVIAPAVLISALTAQANVALPPGLSAAAATDAALGGSVASFAAELARLTLGKLSLRAALTGTGAVAMLAVAMVIGVFHLAGRDAASPQPLSVAAAPATARPVRAIRVGVYMSRNTSQTLTARDERAGKARPVDADFRILRELKAPDVELIPLVEPGGDADPAFAAALERNFPGKRPQLVTDVEVLRHCNVIVAAAVCFPTPEALSAIEDAVGCGTGLVIRQCLGGDHFGYANPTVRRLRLVGDCEPDAIRPVGSGHAEVIGSHPILGDLSGQLGTTIAAPATGAYGTLAAGATPLLRMTSTDCAVYDDDRRKITPRPGYAIYPLAVGMLGRGRVVTCSFIHSTLPAGMKQATNGTFSLRAVRWAAGRPVDGPRV